MKKNGAFSPHPIPLCFPQRGMGGGRLQGFTLLELLVAVGIFSLAALGMYAVFQTGMLSYKKLDAAAGVLQQARILFSRMELDLKNSFVYSDTDARFQGREHSLEFFAVLDSYRNGESRVDACRVSYGYTNGVLTRACAVGARAIQPGTAAVPEQLANNLTDFSFSYAQSVAGPQAPYAWTTQWPDPMQGAQKMTRPLAVRIRLVFAGPDGEREFIKTIGLEETQRNG